MKTKVCKILTFLIVMAMIVSLYSCKVDMTGKFTVVVGGGDPKEYIIEIDKLGEGRGLVPVLNYLKKNHKLDYKIESGELVKLGSVEYNSAKSEYVCIYTTVASDVDRDPITIDYNGMRIKNAGVSLYDMHIEERAVIYIGIIRYL